jgi:hypothetical protein
MNYFKKLLFALFLLPLFSLAQSNFKPGYVVTIKGDTLKGFIDYREWDKNPTDITFKNNLNSQTEIFTTTNAMEFGLNGLEYFKQFNVRISQDQVELSNVKQGIDTSYLTGNVFLRTLTSGKNISLFCYTDKIKTRYYIQEGRDGSPVELVYRVYYSIENSTVLQTENRFRTQLEFLEQKYKVSSNELDNQILYSQYLEADLVKIARALNRNAGPQITRKKLFGTRWYAGSGVSNYSMGFTGAIKYPNSNSFFPKISAGLDLLTNKYTQKFFIRAEFSFNEAKHSFSNGPDASDYATALSEVVQTTFSFSPQIVYNLYNSDKFKLFFDAAVSINVSSYNRYNFVETFSNNITTTSNEFPAFNRVWDSFPFKAGFILNKKIEIYAGYSFPIILTNHDVFAGNGIFNGNVTVYQAGINYLFGVK